MSDLQVVQASMKIIDMLTSHGISVEQFSDFRKFKKDHQKIKLTDLSGQFQLTKFELYDENAFWLKFTHEGECVAALGSRYERLGERNLASHWSDQQKRIYPKPNKIGRKHSRSAFKISGNVVYSGEFVLKKKYRGNGIAAHMVFLNFLLAHLKWHAEWNYGLMSNQLVMRGFAAQIGYTITEPRGTDWIVPPPGISSHDWLVAIHENDIKDKTRIIVEYGLEPFQLKQRT